MQNSSVCPVCNVLFSRRDVMLRHKRNSHSEMTENVPPGISYNQETLQERSITTPYNRSQFKFQHPYSIVLTGPSGSGKSVLTNKLLCQDVIQPPPERIIWCYGQYQPLYDNVKKHLPGVQFVKGIPDFIEHDTYLNTSVRNCIILDDLMGDAKKDERVANLFTKRSHHRNLTVLYLTQNLFPQGKSSRDISLNTKYLVLFNNPVDRNQVSNLARRIYPTNSHHLMNIYKGAVEIPYGHLIVDLRTNTQEQDRLRAKILNEGKSSLPDTDMTNFIRGKPSYEHQMSLGQLSDESDIDMPTCDACGIVFGDDHSLQKHVKQCCVAKTQNMDDEDISPRKTDGPKEWITLPADDSSEEDDENEKEVFTALFERAQDSHDSEWQRKRDKYLDRNVSEKDAREEADEKMMPVYIKDVLEIYTLLIQRIYDLRGGSVHRKVTNDIEKFIERDMNKEMAIKAAVKNNRHLIETLLENLTPEDQSETESEGDGIEDVSSEEE